MRCPTGAGLYLCGRSPIGGIVPWKLIAEICVEEVEALAVERRNELFLEGGVRGRRGERGGGLRQLCRLL